jgi:hypothetical protein
MVYILLNQQDINVLKESDKKWLSKLYLERYKISKSRKAGENNAGVFLYCHLCVSLMNVYILIQLHLISLRPSNTPILQQIYM